MPMSNQPRSAHGPAQPCDGPSQPLSFMLLGDAGQSQQTTWWGYRLAGEGLVSNVPLTAFGAGRPDMPGPGPGPGPTTTPVDSRRAVRGWIGGATRAVICRGEAGSYRIDVAGIGGFTVDATAGRISCNRLHEDVSAARLEEVLLGPPITFALAGRDVWCLHASTVVVEGRAVLFLGHSGQGKSTLAGFCDGPGRMERVADDITPCALVDGRPCAQPHFPQLKLPAAVQYAVARDGNIPIGALVFLEPAGRDGPIQVDALPRVQALRRLCEQTVAIGLFDPWLHQRQLAFVSRLLAEVPAMCLRYPHDYGRLAAVCATLFEHVACHVQRR